MRLSAFKDSLTEESNFTQYKSVVVLNRWVEFRSSVLRDERSLLFFQLRYNCLIPEHSSNTSEETLYPLTVTPYSSLPSSLQRLVKQPDGYIF